MSSHQPQYEQIQAICKELLQEAKNSDTTYVADILENVGQNWRSMESALQRRISQWEQRREAFEKFDEKVKDGNRWLDGMEDKVQHLQPIASDGDTISIQIQQLEVGRG